MLWHVIMISIYNYSSFIQRFLQKKTNILSCDYRYQKSDLVKLDILLNGQPVDAMAAIVHNLKAQRVGRELVDKLKKFIDRYGTGLHLGTIWLWCLLVIHALIP